MKLYLITREDLVHGQQAVQAAHALREFTALHPREDLEWYERSRTLALLSTPGERNLYELLERARMRGVSAAPFYEPDRGHELTAIAIGPKGKGLCRQLPLALG